MQIFDALAAQSVGCVVVTKYHPPQQVMALYDKWRAHSAFVALGENRANRITQLAALGVPRGHLHMIGNLQSRDFTALVAGCSAVHSLAKPDHAHKLNAACAAQNQTLGVFAQVNVSGEPHKQGIAPEALPELILAIKSCPHLMLLGVCGMGRLDFNIDQKHAEMQLLTTLRDEHCTGLGISAGTSADWQICMQQGATVVRLGRVLSGVL